MEIKEVFGNKEKKDARIAIATASAAAVIILFMFILQRGLETTAYAQWVVFVCILIGAVLSFTVFRHDDNEIG